MKKRLTKRNILILFILFSVLILFAPLIAPIIHNDDSPRSAIRNYIYNHGYPYQSFFTLITRDDFQQNSNEIKFDVVWNNWKSETGMTPSICYAKKGSNNKYNVSCGTGP